MAVVLLITNDEPVDLAEEMRYIISAKVISSTMPMRGPQWIMSEGRPSELACLEVGEVVTLDG